MFASDPPAVGRTPHEALPARSRPRWEADFVAATVETPLLSLGSIARSRGARFELRGKAEYRNPSGSVKDRAAAAIVFQALRDGSLSEERGLIDASSGNTAVAYAALGAHLGFPVTICIPANANPERLRRLIDLGAEIVLTDPLESTDGSQREARQRAGRRPERYFYADQYNNPANPQAHYLTTGPEIWRQTAGRVTHLVAGVGTGGTISGTSRYLKSRDPTIRTIGVQPDGPLHGIEGLKHLPTALRPSTYDERWVDESRVISTEEAEGMRRELARVEKISVGRSGGAAVSVALALGIERPGSVVVAILPDAIEDPEKGSAR